MRRLSHTLPLLLMTKARRLMVLMGWAAFLSGCGYPLPDRVQILADTIPPGASCVVSRGDQLIDQIALTPGIVLVPNEQADYLVACRRHAYQEVSAVVHVRAATAGLFYYLGSTELPSRGGASITLPLLPAVAPSPRR